MKKDHSGTRTSAVIGKKKRAEAEALFLLGNHYLEMGDPTRAEANFRKAVRLTPDFAEAHANLGLVLDRKGAGEAAEACYRRAIALDPDLPETHLNLGALLAGAKRFAEAETAYRASIALRPQSPAGWSNLGALLASVKREEEAERCYRSAMALDASYATARFNLSYLLLRQGRFEEGWSCLEARNWYAPLAAHLACPRWQGEALAGKSILIGYEAGHGDMIQFCRYMEVLKAQGAASISMICHPALKTLFAELGSLDRVISFNGQIPVSDWDFWTPLLSLPHYCKTRLDSIPAKIPYLKVSPERMAKWAPLLPDKGLRVGLVWKGNPLFENDGDRSVAALDVLAPLWTVDGVSFISLQKGAGEAEAAQPPAGLALLDLGAKIADFADTAAVVMNLDLVICVDTAVAHLAGALGKPCWVLLPDYKTDWRWMTGRSDSPWYPGVMRLFRQATEGDWSPVVAEVVGELAAMVSASSAGH